MSGIEVLKKAKEKQIHVCASCMQAVIRTFSNYQEQIKKLRSEKADLQEKIQKLKRA
jgi:predicted phage-related endonuclease